MRIAALSAIIFVFVLLASACNLAPAPAATAVPTATASPEPTPTITPTLGPREFINAVFCWESPVDDAEYNLLRLFDDGTVIDATVQPFGSCQEAVAGMSAFMTVDQAMSFGHGEYFLSGGLIRFELAAPHSTTIVGEAFGEIVDNTLTLTKGGATQVYDLIP